MTYVTDKINKRKIQILQPEADITTINVPPPKKYVIYVKVTGTKHTIYTYQTYRLAVTSRRGPKCLMIIFEVDSNAILA